MVPDDSQTSVSVDEWRQRGQTLLAGGAPIVAYDTLADGLAAFPGDARLRQLLALALARSGASRAAIPILEALRGEGHVDEETIGLLARAHKDLWSEGGAPDERRAHLQAAHNFYAEAHRLSGGIWSGINAATTALLLGRRDDAATLARSVRDRCLKDEAGDPSCATNYWHLATLAEAHLILGEWSEAEAAYARATEVGRGRPADTASTRRNARLILGELGADAAAIERVLRVPRVIAFAGHLIDTPGRKVPRFPPALEAAATAAIRERLTALDAGFGFSSGACGADIIFLEALRERNGETTIVLPYDADQFEQDSVAIVPGSDWSARYRRALASARDVFLASEQRVGSGEVSYEYAVLLLEGLAGIRADELDAELVRVVLWDGKAQGGRGGTAPTIQQWRREGHRVEVIDLGALLRESGLPIAVAPAADPAETSARWLVPKGPAPSDPGTTFEPEIVSLLFADAKGFSGLKEDQIPAFVDHFLGMVGEVLGRSANPPRLKNTWGDGLYFVFGSVRDAGLFALDLQGAIATMDWSRVGLPSHLSLRTGLHAGPAYSCQDPVTERLNYFGAHVSRAARIEPITPVGQVYASAAFAALARAEGVREFRCEYVGRTPLAKSYGTLAMYVVRRRAAQGA
jgi:class 3 adenylate cyclase